MNLEKIRNFCLSLENVTEDMPFGNDTLVFRVGGKLFALVNLDGDLSINLKCDPALALELRASHDAVQPGYHMNKMHWNTVYCDGSIKDDYIFEWTRHSYDLVSKSLPGKHKEKGKLT